MRFAVFVVVALLLAGCSEGQDLTAAQLSTVVDAAQPRLQACYQAALDRDPSAPHDPIQAQAIMHVDVSGTVTDVELQLPSDAQLSGCVTEVLKGLQFPAAEAPTHASLPLVFSADSDAAP